MYRVIALALLLWSCGSSQRHDAPAWPAQARALADALVELDRRGDDVTRAETSRAIAALLEWDRANVHFVPPCHRSLARLGPGILAVGRAVQATATDPMDPALHAVARIGRELRGRDNTGMSMLAGLILGRAIVNWGAAHPGSSNETLRAYLEIDENLAVSIAAATIRCNAELVADPSAPLEAAVLELRSKLEGARRAENLPLGPGWFEDEIAALRAFGRDTAKRARLVEQKSAVTALIAERQATAARSNFLLVRFQIDSLIQGVETRMVENEQSVDELRAAVATLR